MQKTKHSEPEMEIPQHLVQHVASQVIGGHSQGPPSYQPPAPDQAEQAGDVLLVNSHVLFIESVEMFFL